MRIRDVMTTDPVCCTADTSIVDAARMMVERDCGAVPVVNNEVERRPIGILTDRDIVTRTVAKGFDPRQHTVAECMTSPAVTIRDEASIRDCLRLLEAGQIRRAIIVDASGACCGIIAQADIALHASKRETGDLVRQVSQPSEPAFAT